MQFPKLLLASKSPRRKEILTLAGFDFEVVNIEADEDFPSNLHRAAIAEFLAKHKAEHYNHPLEQSILVTADTIVCIDQVVLNKPSSEQEAFEMLSLLSGKTHTVYTGVCLKSETHTHVFHDATEVTFYELTSEEITSYIKNCRPFDKAGSYGIQDWMGYVGVKQINGCYFNVMGFPSAKFYRELQQFLAQ